MMITWVASCSSHIRHHDQKGTMPGECAPTMTSKHNQSHVQTSLQLDANGLVAIKAGCSECEKGVLMFARRSFLHRARACAARVMNHDTAARYATAANRYFTWRLRGCFWYLHHHSRSSYSRKLHGLFINTINQVCCEGGAEP